MLITWEDRKGCGFIDGKRFTEKPVFSFDYAWFKVTGDYAQYVESHEFGYWNKDLSLDHRNEIVDYYDISTAEKPAPSSNLRTVVMIDKIRDASGKLCPVWGEEGKFHDGKDGKSKKEQEEEYLAALKKEKYDGLRNACHGEIQGMAQDEIDNYGAGINDLTMCLIISGKETHEHYGFCKALLDWVVDAHDTAKLIIDQAEVGEVLISAVGDVIKLLPDFKFSKE